MKLTLLPLQDDDVIRVRCDGDLTLRGQGSGGDPLEALLGPRSFGHKVVVNLEKAQSIDTSGVSWLMGLQERFRKSNGRLVFYGISPRVTQTLDFLRLMPLLTTAPTEAAALAWAEEGTSVVVAHQAPEPVNASLRNSG
jgi:anti-anti-sigma factor